MLDENHAFVQAAVFGADATFTALMTGTATNLSSAIAPIYGAQSGAMSLDPSQRAGLMTRVGFLTVTGSPTGSHPVKRGRKVYERFLCGTLPPPPNNVPPTKPASAGGTTRQRFEEHDKNPCAVGCHTLMDPLGFPFEHYDGIGRYRTMDNFEHYDGIGRYRTMDNGLPVDSSTSLTVDGTTHAIADAVDLSKVLAESPTAQGCFTAQWARFAMLRDLTDADRYSMQTGANRVQTERPEGVRHAARASPARVPSCTEASPKGRHANDPIQQILSSCSVGWPRRQRGHVALAPRRKGTGRGAAFPKRIVTVTWGNGVIADTLLPEGRHARAVGLRGRARTVQGEDDDFAGPRFEGAARSEQPRIRRALHVPDAVHRHRRKRGGEQEAARANPSNQVIADNIAKTTKLTAPSLNLGVRSAGDGEPTSWKGPGQKNVPETDPKRLFTRLFAGMSTPAPQVDALLLRRQEHPRLLGQRPRSVRHQARHRRQSQGASSPASHSRSRETARRRRRPRSSRARRRPSRPPPKTRPR